eukprot:4076840-Amphidinium_carterae.1
MLQNTSNRSGFTMPLRASSMLGGERFRELLLLYEPATRLDMVNRPSIGLGLTPIDRAAKHGFCENLKTLIEFKADMDVSRKDNGATPLLGAAAEHYPDCVKALLQKRADVHAVDKRGKTALHLTVNPLAVLGNTEANATLECIAILLEAQSDVHTEDADGKTAIDIAKEQHLYSEGLTLLSQASARSPGIMWCRSYSL